MKELKFLNKYLQKYRNSLILGAFFVILSNIFLLFPAQIIRIAFDLVNENINSSFLLKGFKGQDEFKAYIGAMTLVLGGLFLLLALIRGLFLFLMRQTIIVISRKIEFDLKNEIYAHYQVLSLAFYRRQNTGDLMARATEDVSRVRMYLGPAIMYTINTLVLFTLIIGIMLKINIELTLYTILPLPVLFFLIYKVNSVINIRSEEIQTQLSKLSNFVQETFSGIRVIKSYRGESRFEANFDFESQDYKEKSMGLARVQAFFYPTMLLLIGLSTTFAVFIGGIQVHKGLISPGTIAEFILYITQLTVPVTLLGWVSSLIQRAAASQKRINEFLKTQPEIVSETENFQTIRGEIELNHVSFTYPETGIKAIQNLSFRVSPGQVLAILGKTGSGKTTLANLITRMYDIDQGAILIDGRDIREYNLQNLRESIGFVPQDVFLFSDSIENNIGFGMDHFNQEEVESSARAALVYRDILQFPKGFQTLVGERGITLSGGQKQRVSIARAIIKKSPILLFDDCLSAVDTATEEEILKNLGKIRSGKTFILISHRVSTIKNADIILVLDQGKIIESGNHASLMLDQGAYYELFEKQLLETEKVN
jgi:ATP-binding cassette subfamily B protein